MEPSLILPTWSLNFYGGMFFFFVKRSVIINSMLKCSMTIFFSLTHSLMAKYLMSIYLLWLQFLLFLAMKITTKLSQHILNDLEIESTILRPKIEHINHACTMWGRLQTINELSLHRGRSSQSLLCTSPRYSSIASIKICPNVIFVNQHNQRSLNRNNQLPLNRDEAKGRLTWAAARVSFLKKNLLY